MELLHPTVERFFSGTLLRARPVLQKPGYVIAQLACRPPEQTIRELLEGARIEARLQWRPPLLALPLVRIAAVLSTVGLAIWLLGLVVGWLAAMMGRPVASNSRPQGNGQPAPALGVGSTPGPLETGSVSALHELLGERLREVVLRDEVDTDLLASIEWALDRHHVRAVRQMRAGFHWDAALARRVAQLRSQWEGDHGPSHSVSDGNGHRYSRDRERILRVLRAIDAEPFGVWSGSCDSEI
jgi:hypothetical protein